jgi:hypothetical protein
MTRGIELEACRGALARFCGHTLFTDSYTGMGHGRRKLFEDRWRRQPPAHAGMQI